MNDINVWTAQDVKNAIVQDNANLELIFSNYLKGFVSRLGDYDISIQAISSVENLQKQILQGIDSLEAMRREIISVIDLFSTCNHPLLLKYLHGFLFRILTSYEEAGISLYAGDRLDALRNDHYRFFNQFLFISLSSVLLENRCFNVLRSILFEKYPVFYKSYGTVRNETFMQFRKYNYTLNQFLNTGAQKRISVTADYIKKFSSDREFTKLIRADILLYYLSLFITGKSYPEECWHPELSVYNRDKNIMPYMASKAYFEQAKVLFGVDTTEEYKQKLDNTADPLVRDGSFGVPTLKIGLMYDSVGSLG